jgi:hypothetical protein
MSPQSGVTIHRSEQCDDGYRLYSGRQTEEAHLIEPGGQEVHVWQHQQGFTWHYAEMLPNGHLLAVIKEQEDKVPGMVLELDWESNLIWQADVPAHHDLDRLESGNTLIVGREYVRNEKIRDGTIKSDYIVELTPMGKVAWEWHIDQHVGEIADLVPVELPAEHRDWAHTNTVESLPENAAGVADGRFREGNVLTSPRNLDTVCVIDRDTGEVVWAWGPGQLDKQHMPTMLTNGNMLIFDNGTERGYSRVIEIEPISGEIAWEYVADPPESFYTPTRGANERLPNGNTFITDSDNGRLFEVTPDGEIVWEFHIPQTRDDGSPMPMYRALRYPRNLVDALILNG